MASQNYLSEETISDNKVALGQPLLVINWFLLTVDTGDYQVKPKQTVIRSQKSSWALC